MKAIYVSEWDRGSSVFRSNCEFNPETKEVTNVESLDVDDEDLNYCDAEYIELPDGETVRDFNMDGSEYKDGQRED